MRAAILNSPGADPQVGEFDDPIAADGQALVDVSLAGVNPIDIRVASGQFGGPRVPSIVGFEGVGTLADGRRVYFSPAISPYGSWAERALVDPALTFPVPDGLSDDLAVAMGIPALAAWLALEHHAHVGSADNVLVLGATGTVGRVAVQGAKLLGAARVTAAARDADALRSLRPLGVDATVVLGAGDDAQALKDASDGGFDVVIDPLYGAPFEAALGATALHARVVTLGESAGAEARVPFRALQGRTHIGHGSQLIAKEIVRDTYARLTRHALAGEIEVEVERFSLEHAVDAWHAQQRAPRRKLLVAP
ncbi:MAG TPA: zinc-binding alcohol dehydrogenase family protein [Solirubrobacteraceae bacterium]|jgi:NADPH:quinone reductase-like Zn-dependent oxidoreductase|nr:zinc-binding alcohol dehydrogenase family protein [Solirubrobacteraceae bacterium]